MITVEPHQGGVISSNSDEATIRTSNNASDVSNAQKSGSVADAIRPVVDTKI
jgi:hypothetical protein